MTYKQRGKNNKYPAKIEVWRIGEKVPEWLSDRAKVKFIDGEGNVTLDRRDRGDGSYEIRLRKSWRRFVLPTPRHRTWTYKLTGTTSLNLRYHT